MYNFVCVKWGDKFGPEYVNTLFNMIKKNISSPFVLHCITENSNGINKNVNVVDFKSCSELKHYWVKLILFNKKFTSKFTSNTFLYFDLDVVITGALDEMFDYKRELEFIGVIDWNRKLNKQFNSSVMRITPGKNNYIYDDFFKKLESGKIYKKIIWDHYLKSYIKPLYYEKNQHKNPLKYLYRFFFPKQFRGDQQWISWNLRLPGNLEDFAFPNEWILSYKTHAQKSLPPGCKVLVFHGYPKPHEVEAPHIKILWKEYNC